ncbi:MAG TPA: hypothetical protein VIL49_03010 [Capillimicrobium sp.]
MAEHWKLTVRSGPKVDVSRHASRDAALDALAGAAGEAGDVRRGATKAFVRDIQPGAQVPVRLEVSGPQRLLARVRGGVDLRGDGSAQAWTGRLSKQVVEPVGGESAVDALRRALSSA